MPPKAPNVHTETTAALDHTAFPHLVDLILGYTTFDAWVVLRGVSRALRARMEALMCRHVVLEEDNRNGVHGMQCDDGCSYLFTSPTERQIIPCLPLASDRKHTLARLSKYTVILDDATGTGTGTQRPSPLPAGTLHNLRLVRRPRHGLEMPATKTVLWHDLPVVRTAEDEDDDLDFGAQSPHQVHHMRYARLAVALPQWYLTGGRSKVFIFEERESDAQEARTIAWHAAHPAPGVECGRALPAVEMARILSLILGAGDSHHPVKITFVGLDELLLPPRQKEPRVALRNLAAQVNTYSNSDLKQCEFLTHEEYRLRVGREQYELETIRPKGTGTCA